jgi:hypothetical protein
MSRYFEPIDIRPKEEPKLEPVNTDLIQDVTPALEEIDKIMSDLITGTSPFKATAVYFLEGKSSPVKESLSRLRKAPTSRKALHEFVLAAQGDLGRRVAQAMMDHLLFADSTIKGLIP